MKNNAIPVMVSRIPMTVTNRLSGWVLLMVLFAPVSAVIAKVNTGTDGVAVHGYDVVAYFLEGRAVRGTSEFEHDWQDAKWQFASAASKDLFAANPERYAPQYGGFCATCLALDGELTDANPKAWTIVEGKLYLNYSMHQRTQWRIRSNVYVQYGDDEWTRVVALEGKRAAADSLIKVAILPVHGKEASGEVIRHQILPTALHDIVNEGDAFILSYSSLSPETEREISISDDIWPGDPVLDFARTIPPSELVNRIGKQLGVSGVLLYSYKLSVPRSEVPTTQDQFHWKGFFFDIDQNRVYEQHGNQSSLESATKELLDEFLAGRESYRIAVVSPGFYYDGRPWKPSGDSDWDSFGGIGGDIYSAILNQSSFIISYADEPIDSSARGEVARGMDWPFPGTNVDRMELWNLKPDLNYMTPNLMRVYRAGRKLGIDAVVTYFFRPAFRQHEWLLEVYVIDIEQQRVYLHKGTNGEASMLVRQAFSDFVAGRKL